jgi:phage-related protein
MAGKPQVTLTFAGDSSKLTKAFDDVGSSARTMDTDVGNASKKISDSSSGFDRAGDAADGAEGKAQGFADTLEGSKGIMDGVGEIAKGNLFEGFVMAGSGAANLAGGMASFLIPMGKTAIVNAMAGAQKALNAVMRANPIGIVITVLALLVTGIIIAYKKSETFRAIVDGAMKGIKKAFGWVVDKGKELVGWFKTLPGKIGGYFKGVTDAGAKVIDWFKALPGKIGGFFKGLGDTIKKPFSSAFQGIKDLWNSTVGGKGFSVPDWIPGIGGKSFTIPYFHTGGIVPGSMGSETLAVLKAGERVTGGSNSPTPLPAMGDIYITIEMDGQQFDARIKSVSRDRDRELKRTVKAA